MASYSYRGFSGRNYTYMMFRGEDVHKLPLQAGNYIFATTDCLPVFIETAESVRKSAAGFWQIASSVHGATLALIHVDSSLNESKRQQEKMDLVDQYHPPMNRQGDPAEAHHR